MLDDPYDMDDLTKDQLRHIVQQLHHVCHVPMRTIAMMTNIPKSTVSSWVKKYNGGRTPDFRHLADTERERFFKEHAQGTHLRELARQYNLNVNYVMYLLHTKPGRFID